MNFNEKPKMTGVFHLEIKDTDGNVLETYHDDNLIVNGGRVAVTHLIGGDVTDRSVDRIAFGTNGAEPLITDDAITDQFAKAVDSVTYPATETVQFDFSLGLAENNDVTIREFGLLCVDDVLFSRKIRAAIIKTDEIMLEGYWAITF